VTTRTVRLLLTGWGASAAIALGVELVRADALGSVGPEWALSFLAAYLVGIWAFRAEPGNRAALRLLVYGCTALTFLAVSTALIVLVRSGIGGTGFVLANLAAQTVSLLFVCSQVAALVRYPDGKPRLAIERRLVGTLLGIAAVLPVALLLTRATVVPAWIVQFSGESDGLAVPVVASGWYQDWLAWLGPVTQLLNDSLLAVAPLIGVGVAAARYRHLDAAQRQRMAWPLQAALLLILGVVINAVAEGGALPRVVGEGVYIVCHILLPVALGIGIAAPGIFDALGTARRTVSFAALSLLILGSYVAAAGLLGVTVGGDDLRVAVIVAVISTLALDPVRRTLQRRAGRLAFGHEVSRDELLLRLGDTLEHTMDRNALTESIAETAMEGLATQWVRLEPDGAPAVHVGRPARSGEKATHTSRLMHGHDDLGAISCGPPVSGRAGRRSRIQLDTLSRQIAMALTNARLADELNGRLAEIDASRQRLVTAEEAARRRIERDLHDGAQQDLAALLTRIALARNQLRRSDVGRLEKTLANLQTDAGDALKNLRELVSGIHQSTLADQGLVVAVENRAATSPIPIEVTCGPGVRDGRLAAAVESTAYFTVCEALANTLKHGDARRATIAMVLDDGRLRIAVTDDGRGFDPLQVNGSTGLVGLRDRIAAVGGTLDVRSEPGRGTTLTAIVPTRA
jgi:signal transduction histidine kinase